jgi:hypothetical protein
MSDLAGHLELPVDEGRLGPGDQERPPDNGWRPKTTRHEARHDQRAKPSAVHRAFAEPLSEPGCAETQRTQHNQHRHAVSDSHALPRIVARCRPEGRQLLRQLEQSTADLGSPPQNGQPDRHPASDRCCRRARPGKAPHCPVATPAPRPDQGHCQARPRQAVPRRPFRSADTEDGLVEDLRQD